MKLPRTALTNLTPDQYRELLKILPDMHKEKNKAILMLIFTFLALAILGIFAINPTLTTIFDLQKQVKENQFVHDQLTGKMNALSSLQQQYNTLSSELPIVYDAIPKEAKATLLVAQIQGIARQTGITIKRIEVSEVPLTKDSAAHGAAVSFTLSLEAEGGYDALINFATLLTDFSRIVTIDSIALSKDQTRDVLILQIQSREYFKK